MEQRKYLLAMVLIAAAFAVLALGARNAAAINDPPAGGGAVAGDWTVTDVRSYSNCQIDLTGNLIIDTTGNLTLNNVLLKMKLLSDGQFSIVVQSGGQLYVNGGTITSSDTNYEFKFIVESNTILSLEGTALRDIGYDPDGYSVTGGLLVRSNNARLNKCIIESCHVGLIIDHANVNVTNTIIRNLVGDTGVYDHPWPINHADPGRDVTGIAVIGGRLNATNVTIDNLLGGNGGFSDKGGGDAGNATGIFCLNSTVILDVCTISNLTGGNGGNIFSTWVLGVEHTGDGGSGVGLASNRSSVNVKNTIIKRTFNGIPGIDVGWYYIGGGKAGSSRGILSTRSSLNISGNEIAWIAAREQASTPVGISLHHDEAIIYSNTLTDIGVIEYSLGMYTVGPGICIRLEECNQTTVRGNDLSGNTWIDWYRPFTGIEVCGFLDNTKQPIVTGNYLHNLSYAIIINDGAAPVTNNTLADIWDTGIRLFNSTADVKGNIIERAAYAGIMVTESDPSVSLNNLSFSVYGIVLQSSNGTYRNNSICNISTGFYILNTVSPLFIDNRFSDIGYMGFFFDNAAGFILDNPLPHDTLYGLYCGGKCNVTWNITKSTILMRAPVEFQGTLTVFSGGRLSINNSALYIGSIEAGKSSIDIRAGARFEMANGSCIGGISGLANYRFRSRAMSEISLIDSSIGNCGIQGPPEDNGPCLETNNRTLKNMTFKGSYAGLVVRTAENVTLDGLSFENNYIALLCTDAVQASFDRCNFYHNNITLLSPSSSRAILDGCNITGGNPGLYCPNATNINVTACTFTGNDIGLLVHGSQYANIAGNIFTGNDCGILCMLGSRQMTLKCTFSDNENGIVLENGAKSQMASCDFLHNTLGISCEPGSSAGVDNCTFNLNSIGLKIDCAVFEISNSTILYSRLTGVYVTGLSRFSFMENCQLGWNVIGITCKDVPENDILFGRISFSRNNISINCINASVVFANCSIPLSLKADASLDLRTTLTIINSTFDNDKVDFLDTKSVLKVFRHLNIHATWQNGADIDTPSLELRDRDGAIIWIGTGDDNGNALGLTVLEYEQTTFLLTYHTPLTITASKGGLTESLKMELSSSSQVEIIVIDDVSPVLTVSSPSGNHVQNSTVLLVCGTASDNILLAKLEISLDGSEWKAFAVQAGWNVSLMLDDGVFTVYIRATDHVGNLRTVMVSAITIDTVAPVIFILSPENGTATSSGRITVSGTTEPSLDVYVNGVRTGSSMQGAFYSTVVFIADGEYAITVMVQDSAGNRGEATVIVVYDTTAPVISITSPANNGRTNKPLATVTGTTENGAAVLVSGRTANLNGTDWSFAGLLLAEGDNYITVRVADGLGNFREMTIRVVLDTRITLAVSFPADNYLTGKTSVKVSGTTDSRATVKIGTVSLSADEFGRFEGEVTLIEGANSLTVVSTDDVGNVATINLRVTVDTTAPTVELTGPADKSMLEVPIAMVTGKTEAGAEIEINGMTLRAGRDGSFGTVLALNNGTNAIYIRVYDAAGNVNEMRLNVTYTPVSTTVSVPKPVTLTKTDSSGPMWALMGILLGLVVGVAIAAALGRKKGPVHDCADEMEDMPRSPEPAPKKPLPRPGPEDEPDEDEDDDEPSEDEEDATSADEDEEDGGDDGNGKDGERADADAPDEDNDEEPDTEDDSASEEVDAPTAKAPTNSSPSKGNASAPAPRSASVPAPEDIADDIDRELKEAEELEKQFLKTGKLPPK